MPRFLRAFRHVAVAVLVGALAAPLSATAAAGTERVNGKPFLAPGVASVPA